MKSKPKKKSAPKQAATTATTAAEIARQAGCSRPLVHRLLARGMTAAEIITRAARRAQLGTKASAQKRTMPSTVPPFALSQARKEQWLAELRSLEVREKKRELAPVYAVQSWVTETISHIRNHMVEMPVFAAFELVGQDEIRCRAVLERVVKRIFEEGSRFSRQSARRYGLLPPPPLPPPPPREELPYYQSYVRDAIDGTREHVGAAQQLGSIEWHRLHPSIDLQQSFELRRKRDEWNKDMAALLARRVEWDLPPELDAAPPSDGGDMEEI